MSSDDQNNLPPDFLIDEVRSIRRKLTERFGNDIDKLCDYLQQQERQRSERIVELDRVTSAESPG